MIVFRRAVFRGLLLVSICCEAADPVVRRPARAGQFYPGTKSALTASVDSYLAKAPRRTGSGKVVAAMVPHAGYRFSAGVGAHVYAAMTNAEFETVIIIGHDCGPRAGVAIVCDVDSFDTPLGRVRVDTDMVNRIIAHDPGIRADRAIHSREHSVEVHLPFLQRIKKDVSIVPVLFGEPTVKNCRTLAKAISATAGDRKIMVIASTDLSHYPPYAEAVKMDKATLKAVETLDIDKLFELLAAHERADPKLRTAMCARGGVGTAMILAVEMGANSVEVLRYSNSGDVKGGDRSGVVGYGAALFVKNE